MVNSDRWEVNKTLQASPEGPGRNLFRWKGTDIEIIKTHQIYEGRLQKTVVRHRDPKRFNG